MEWWQSEQPNKNCYPELRLTFFCSTDGNLWIAMWGTWTVCKYSPKGELLQTIKFPARNQACTTWGGPNNDWLYIATASDRSGKAGPDDQGGHLFRYKVEGGVQGMPKYEFDG